VGKYSEAHKDIVLSVLSGPFKLLIPIIGYAVVYPVIISNSGIVVVGIFALLSTFARIMRVSDIGFTAHITRKSTVVLDNDVRTQLIKEIRIANLFYLFFSIICIITTYIFFDKIVGVQEYSEDRIFISIILLIFAVTLMLSGSLYGAVLSGQRKNYIVQITQSISPIFQFSVMIYASFTGWPLEGYALGMLLTAILQYIIFRIKTRSILSSHDKTTIIIRDLYDLAKDGFYHYMISIGFLVREPVFRFTILTFSTLEILGLYEIAFRLITTVRDLITVGFRVLYPSMSWFHKHGHFDEITKIIVTSLSILLVAGAAGFISLSIISSYLYEVWIGYGVIDLVRMSTILSIWALLTIINVPFWHLLRATGHEKYASHSLWIHTLLILLLIPLSKVYKITIDDALLYWLATSLGTQCFIYYIVHVQFNIIKILSKCDISLLVLILSSIFILSIDYLDQITVLPTIWTEFLLLSLYLALAISIWRVVTPLARSRFRITQKNKNHV